MFVEREGAGASPQWLLTASPPLPGTNLGEAGPRKCLYLLASSAHCRVGTAKPPKADMCGALAHVCFVPKADISQYSDLPEALPNELMNLSFAQSR